MTKDNYCGCVLGQPSRPEWAVTADGKVVHMSASYYQAASWAKMRKGIYKIRRLTDEDFGVTAPIGRMKDE